MLYQELREIAVQLAHDSARDPGCSYARVWVRESIDLDNEDYYWEDVTTIYVEAERLRFYRDMGA